MKYVQHTNQCRHSTHSHQHITKLCQALCCKQAKDSVGNYAAPPCTKICVPLIKHSCNPPQLLNYLINPMICAQVGTFCRCREVSCKWLEKSVFGFVLVQQTRIHMWKLVLKGAWMEQWYISYGCKVSSHYPHRIIKPCVGCWPLHLWTDGLSIDFGRGGVVVSF